MLFSSIYQDLGKKRKFLSGLLVYNICSAVNSIAVKAFPINSLKTLEYEVYKTWRGQTQPALWRAKYIMRSESINEIESDEFCR